MAILDKVATVVLIIGGLNWGLVALDYNLVDSLFGEGSALSRLVYALVGLAAVWCAYTLVRGASDNKSTA